jgi:hypothetical protein
VTRYAGTLATKTKEAQWLLAALDEELAASAKQPGEALELSAAEKDIPVMIGAAVDRMRCCCVTPMRTPPTTPQKSALRN